MPISHTVHEFELPDGKTYRIGEFRNRDYDQFQLWINRQPRPRAVVPDLSGVLGEVATQVATGITQAGPEIAPEARVRLIQELTRRCLSLAESQLREARYEAQQWPPAVGEAGAGRLIMTAPGGKAELLYVALQRFHPEVTRPQAEQLAGDMDYETFMEIVAVVFGQKQTAEDSDPNELAPEDGEPQSDDQVQE